MSWLLIGTSYLMLTSGLFMFLVHPLAMGLTLISQTILICSVTALTSKMSWFSYILFLIFLGATLVLFIYVAALASNETFKLSFQALALKSSLIAPLLIAFTFNEQTLLLKSGHKQDWLTFNQELNPTSLCLTNIYNSHNIFLTGLIILYLLLTLLVVVKISSTFSGPLRLA